MNRNAPLLVILAALLATAGLALAQDGHDHSHGDDGHHGENDRSVTGPLLGLNESWEQVFVDEETWTYHCHPHPFMTGTVVVSATDPEAKDYVNVTIQNHDFFPKRVVVKPLGTVNWTNKDPVEHNAVLEPQAPADTTAEEHGDHRATPGPGLWMALGALGAVALALRRLGA